MKKTWRAIWFVPVLLLAASCGGTSQEHEAAPVEPAAPSGEAGTPVLAVARIEPKNGSDLTGRADFVYENGEVTMTVELENASPGMHAVHLHEFGDCSAADASSAGGHWNPTGQAHGKWGVEPFHLGDVGNIDVGDDGYGSLTLTTDLWSIGTGDTNDILGKSVVVHSKPDDFSTQPSGAAGERIGCGVIQRG